MSEENTLNLNSIIITIAITSTSTGTSTYSSQCEKSTMLPVLDKRQGL